MHYEVIEDRYHPEHWRVEAINSGGDGEVYVVVFSGPEAQERAEEYAEWKIGVLESVVRRKAG